MEAKIISMKKVETGTLNLPEQFNEEIRVDLIKRAVHALQSHKRQPYGASPTAGKRASAKLSRRRRNYKTSYGIGISRVPRKILSRHGTRMHWVGAFAPGMVGGRRAHPPKAEKCFSLKINQKERIKAIRSAISATIIRDIVSNRGHILPSIYPIVIETEFESVTKTKDVIKIMDVLGLEAELFRVSERVVRSGRGKARGRKYRKKIGPLIVVSGKCNVMMAAKNITGIDIAEVKNLNAEILAPGSSAGRLTIWTESAVRKLEKERLFI